MKKRVSGKQLSRSRTAREALYRSLFKALVEHGSITTTMTKAKALQRYTDKLVATAVKNDVVSRRTVLARLANDTKTVSAVFEHIAPSFEKKSGFTRITPLPKRRGDNVQVAKIEWSKSIERDDKAENKSEEKSKSRKKVRGK